MSERRPSYCLACDDELPESHFEPQYVTMDGKKMRVCRSFNGYCSRECWDVHTTAKAAAMESFKLDWSAKQAGREKCPTCQRWL